MSRNRKGYWGGAISALIVGALGIPVAVFATFMWVIVSREFSGPSGGAVVWLLCAVLYPFVWVACLVAGRGAHKNGDDFVALVVSVIPVILGGTLALAVFLAI